MRNVFKLIQPSPILGLNRANQGIFMYGPPRDALDADPAFLAKQAIAEKVDEVDYSLTESTLAVDYTIVSSPPRPSELRSDDFDFIRSDSMHICQFSEEDFRWGAVDLVHMAEVLSIVEDDDGMMYMEEF